jgi:hypothetical protein
LAGNAEDIASGLLAYAQSGVEHVMLHPFPYSRTSLERLEQSLRIYHQLAA